VLPSRYDGGKLSYQRSDSPQCFRIAFSDDGPDHNEDDYRDYEGDCHPAKRF
jgi:hypothetical protein